MKLLLILMLISSCSMIIGNSGPVSAKNSHYKLKFSSSDWVLKADESSDYVYENKKNGSILLSNSFCKEFQEEHLETLALKTFKIVDKFKIDRQESTTFENREAYRMEGTGSVDGVLVSLKILNTRRNNCYFDFVSINPMPAKGSQLQAFESFLNSVEFKK